ncbi:Fibroblast growth factor-binding protein 1 [Channa argus]|uniref:Fibroblast growth factor-binding protein 1 n=1 Tax=Channa argus TaxID=215402 RepID=A0A6G1PCH7_CHAAH|nr:Fibroblast growth factor-binding protein 1 [Channa argus]
MLLLRTFAPWLLLGFLGGQVTAAPGRAQRLGDKAAETGRGKFTTRDQMQCTWASRDVGDTVKLSVKCENPEARHISLMCQYVAKPRSCPGYLSEPRAFWKQVARALKKLQGKVCTDERALVKAGMCKRAPFKLDKGNCSSDRGAPGSRSPGGASCLRCADCLHGSRGPPENC